MIPHIFTHRFTLGNGLKVIVAPDNRLPVMSQYTFYKVGSRNESTNITGISHLFEHMMFKGSRKFGSGEYDRILETHGGYSNAYTTHDMTVYYENFPPHILPIVMDLNADRMGWLNLNMENLESERDVVKEERRLRTDNSIPGILEELLVSTAYTAHPYRWPVIGWMDDLNHITLEDCQAYFNNHYAPNNATLLLVGDCGFEDVTRLAEQYYGVIPAHQIPKNRFTEEPMQHGERRAVYHKNAQVESCMIAYHVPGVDNGDIFPLDILQTILGDGESCRLYQRLVHEKELAVSVSVDFEWCFNPSLFSFYAKLKPGKKIAELEQTLDAELKSILQKGLLAGELEKANNILLSSIIRGLKTAAGRGNRLGMIETLFDDYQKLFDFPSEYAKVTEKDVQLMVENYFNELNRTVVSVLPNNNENRKI